MKTSPSKQSSILVNSKPADVTLVGGVFWKSTFHTFGNPMPVGTLNHCNVRYPPLAVRLNEQGTTTMHILIATDGSVQHSTVSQSSGFLVLDQVSLECVNAFRFLPATQNGQPVEIERTLGMDWKISRPQTLGPMIRLSFNQDGSVGIEGQRYSDVAALRAKLAEIASRNPRPEICQLPIPGPAFGWGSLTLMSRAIHLLNSAGVPSVKSCSVPFAGMKR